MGGDFNGTIVPRLDRCFASLPVRHGFLALRRLVGRAQLSDFLEAAMELAEEEKVITAIQAAAHTYFYTLPGVGSASYHLDR